MKKHFLVNLDTESRIADCAECGLKVNIRLRSNGRGVKRWRYSKAENFQITARRKRYRTHKGTVCECCGFVPIISAQLDVDHKNGNHEDDAETNLWTLCANCHRLKTLRPDLFMKEGN